MKIVITGGAGFLGSYIIDNSVKEFPSAQIVCIDKLTYAADLRNIQAHIDTQRIQFVQGCVTNYLLVSEALSKADLVIHAAAESHVDNSFENSSHFTESNTLGTHILLQAALDNSVRKFIHVSTDEVYGENNDSVPHNEESNLNPTNPYAASKAAAEMLVNSYKRSFKLPVTIVRANNLFGARQYPEKLIPRTILRLMRGEKAVIHGRGLNYRSFLSANDLSKAILMLIDSKYDGEIFNVGSATELRNVDVISQICTRMGLDFSENVEYVQDRPFNDSRYFINFNKISRVGWQQTEFLEHSWDDIIEWYRNNEERYTEIS